LQQATRISTVDDFSVNACSGCTNKRVELSRKNS
jgi:hypothetical protein